MGEPLESASTVLNPCAAQVKFTRHSAYKKRSYEEEEAIRHARQHGDLAFDNQSWGSSVESSVKSSSAGTYNSDRGYGGDHDGNKPTDPDAMPEYSDTESD